jgi:hypothetical protein
MQLLFRFRLPIQRVAQANGRSPVRILLWHLAFDRLTRRFDKLRRQAETARDGSEPVLPVPVFEDAVNVMQTTQQVDDRGIVDVTLGAQQGTFRCHWAATMVKSGPNHCRRPASPNFLSRRIFRTLSIGRSIQ